MEDGEDHGEDHGVPEEIIAYLSYLIARDVACWDPRRRLRAEHAHALAEQLRDTLSARTRAALDRYLRVDAAA